MCPSRLQPGPWPCVPGHLGTTSNPVSLHPQRNLFMFHLLHWELVSNLNCVSSDKGPWQLLVINFEKISCHSHSPPPINLLTTVNCLIKKKEKKKRKKKRKYSVCYHSSLLLYDTMLSPMWGGVNTLYSAVDEPRESTQISLKWIYKFSSFGWKLTNCFWKANQEQQLNLVQPTSCSLEPDPQLPQTLHI